MELLVVIAIIGVLVGLLLPALQAMREAARRTQCLNNIKQIGLALHLRHQMMNALPPGSVWHGGSSSTYDANGAESTWISHTLQFLEQGNLFDKIDWSRGFGQA